MGFLDFQQQVNEARAVSESRRDELKTARQKANNITRNKDQLLRGISVDDPDERLAELNASKTEFYEAANSAKIAYADALRGEWGKLKDSLHFTNPIENIASLADDCPILLFPLRLETRFKKVEHNGGMVDQLWVRVFPDDIAINSFESDLSDTEIRNVQSYWLARWKAGKDIDGNRGAWRSLASAHGPGRAYWLMNNYVPTNNPDDEPEKVEEDIILVVGTEDALHEPELAAIKIYWRAVWKADKDSTLLNQAWSELLLVVSEAQATNLVKDYKPNNINDLPPVGFTRDTTEVSVELVIFPKTEELETKIHSWSQPPASCILPERFVFTAYHQDGLLAIEPQLGELVPPKLIMGPDPAANQGEDLRLASKEDADSDSSIDEGDLIFSENMRWMFDFDEAVAKGMGFKIDLTPEQATAGFDRVFVIGMKLSADKDKGQNLVEELFAQHQSSRKGLEIIKQGTPTNNTEDDKSGYSWQHDPDDSFDIYFDDSSAKTDPTDWFNKCDGRWLAELLGLDPAKLHALGNYYSTDIAESKAMQRALWPATMGHFMDSMMNPVFTKDVIEKTQTFFTRYVSGRGSLPAIRVGKQPYGILPTTNYTNMKWFESQPDTVNLLNIALTFGLDKDFLTALYQILQDMDNIWMNLQQKAAYVGKEGDPHQMLLDIVGLHPDSVELYARYAESFKQIHNIYTARGFAHEGLFGHYPTSYSAAFQLLANYGFTTKNSQVPDIFKKSFFGASQLLSGDRIDKVPNSEVEPIGIYTDSPDGENYIEWLINAARDSHDRLRLQDSFIDDKPPTSLLYLLLYHALDLSFIDTSLKLHLREGLFADEKQMQQAYVEPDFIHIKKNNETESRWKYLYKSDVSITGNPDVQLEQYISQHIDELEDAAGFRAVLAGLEILKDVPTARLERVLMEHIDTVSYRYDAWILGYLHLQLEQMRGLQDSTVDIEPKRGVYIGAYGWLEDLRPENKALTPVDQLPDELNDVFNPKGDLVEDNSNGGYILAPSQNHAVTAAVLRNGHLSNDGSEDREELKIKLSSQRVRLALQIIEGMQGGQTLSALLGYQFERGLHDRTDVEADQFIFELRNAFPLVAKKFKETAPSDSDYESVEQIEARNVIDGVALLEHIEKTGIKTYPFNLSLPVASGPQEAAITQVVLQLIEINDAVADLALAESVHQVVLGNYDRAAATLDTYSKGNFPPTPDVIQTPRSGIQLTHRVALQFRTNLPGLTLGDSDVTPRMVAEPAIGDWLSNIMPGMDKVACVVTYVDRDSSADKEVSVKLSDLGLAHIDLLYLIVDSDQAMSDLDDLIIYHVMTTSTYKPRMDKSINIEYTRKLDDDNFSVFEVSALIASLRTLLLTSKPLTAADAKLSNEATEENEQTLILDPNRIQPIITALSLIRTGHLASHIDDLAIIIASGNVDDIVSELDTLILEIAKMFTKASSYGMSQTGIGFIYQWQQFMYTKLRGKLDEVIVRWEGRFSEYITLRDEYVAGIGLLSDEVLFNILIKAELKISSTPTVPRPITPAEYFTAINDTKVVSYHDMLDNKIRPMLDTHGLTPLIQGIQLVTGLLEPFDIVGIDIREQLKQVEVFAGDLLTGAGNLSNEIEARETKANSFLASVDETGDSLTKVELVKNAAKAVFGDDFVIVPEFTLDTNQGNEWQNCLAGSSNSLRYLHDDLDMDFPMDDWLYGVSRVREKLYHVENTLLHIEGFNSTTLDLLPAQFPYCENDYWLGLQFPDEISDTEDPGKNKPFTIDEDKLLFTGIYTSTETFDPAKPQCGLLIDEWTEVIPSRDETPGLSFHYDQPNSEPPQTLLLVTPSQFTGVWDWQDLVSTLHETLDMAKKRAVEPDHVDTTVYSRFLPPIVSLTSPLPLTATLNLALNNQVFFAKVYNNE